MSYALPIMIIAIFLLIMALTGLLAMCLYRRFKKGYSQRSHAHGQGEEDEQEALLGRRRSTSYSYYDANRSRGPVRIQHDAKGRPISTWSTASSVAAQRGEELSKWSRRRDDLLQIYGRNTMSSGGDDDYIHDLEEEPELEEEAEEEEQREEHVQDRAREPLERVV